MTAFCIFCFHSCIQIHLLFIGGHDTNPSPVDMNFTHRIASRTNLSSNKDSERHTIEASVVEAEQIRPSAVLKAKPQFSNSKAKAQGLSHSTLALSQDKNKSNKIIRTSVPKVNYKQSQYSVTQNT